MSVPLRELNIAMCLSVCLSASISWETHDHTAPNICRAACCLGPAQAALQYFIYFRFFGWRHFPYGASNANKCKLDDSSGVQYPDRGWSLMSTVALLD